MALFRIFSAPSCRAEGGTVAIEFALIAPFLLTLLAGLVEIGFANYQEMQAQDAAEAGALYAATNGFNVQGISNAVVNATANTSITASPAPVSFCGCPSATGVSAVACASTCVSGDSPGQYVQVNASIAHDSIVPYLGLPIPATLTGQSTVRVD